MNKIVNDAHYHIWSDALHLRQLAREATNKWDRSTYVRAAVVMAWTAFETVLAEALNANRIGGNFRQNVDNAIQANGLAMLDWGQSIWQSVDQLNNFRVDYVHRTAKGADLFPDVSVADDALQIIRNALVDVYSKAGKTSPSWTADDADRGWVGRGKSGTFARGCAIHGGVDPNGSDTIRVAYVDRSGEHICAYHPPDSNAHELAAELQKNLHEPVSAIRIYRGAIIELDVSVRMRGNS
jgi:hypothetical protein